MVDPKIDSHPIISLLISGDLLRATCFYWDRLRYFLGPCIVSMFIFDV